MGPDFNLFVKKGANPSLFSFDYSSTNRYASESITIQNPAQGRYFVLVYANSGSGSYTVQESHSSSMPTPTFTPTQTTPTSTPTLTPTGTPVPADITLRSVQGRFSASGQQAFYSFDIPAGVSSCTVTLTGPSSGADFDLYVKKGSNPTTSSYDYARSGASASETITITNPGSGRYYVMVNAYSGSGAYSIAESHTFTTATPTSVPTTVPVTVTPSATSSPDEITLRSIQSWFSAPGQQAFYYFDVPAEVSSCTLTLVAARGRDFNLYVKKGSNPSFSSYDYASTGSTASETITIQNPGTGRYHVMVYAYSGYGAYGIQESHA
jgi:hypothetical protein